MSDCTISPEWAEEARERMADDERVIGELRTQLAEVQISHARLRAVLYQALAASAGVSPTLAEDVAITFDPHRKQKTKRAKGDTA